MKYVKNFFRHLKTVLTHKYWVCHYCFKCGLYWQGLIHDISKFSPTEFFESVKYYQGTYSPIDACKIDKGYSLAWQHHKGRNKHHFEYWEDGSHAIKMPYRYAIELLCDYLGAGRAYMGSNFSYSKELSWWNNRKIVIGNRMNKVTMEIIDNYFNKLATMDEDIVFEEIKINNKGYKF